MDNLLTVGLFQNPAMIPNLQGNSPENIGRMRKGLDDIKRRQQDKMYNFAEIQLGVRGMEVLEGLIASQNSIKNNVSGGGAEDE